VDVDPVRPARLVVGGGEIDGAAGGLASLEVKSLSVGSNPDGGYLVPLPTEREVLRRLAKLSPIRAISGVREISGASLRRAFSTTGPAAGLSVPAGVSRPAAGPSGLATGASRGRGFGNGTAAAGPMGRQSTSNSTAAVTIAASRRAFPRQGHLRRAFPALNFMAIP